MIADGSFVTRRAGLTLLVAGLLGTPAGLFFVLRLFPQLDVFFRSLDFHLVVVSLIAACAAAVAVLAAVPAGRAKDPSLVFLSLGCLSVGVALLGHGLTTPGVGGMPANMWVARLPSVALAAFATFHAAAVLPPTSFAARFATRRPYLALGIPALAMIGGLAFVVRNPVAGIGSSPLAAEDTLVAGGAVVSALLLCAVGAVHWRRWRLSGDGVQLALVLASLLAAEAQVSMRLGLMWHLSWWDYHVLLILGFGSTVYALFRSYARNDGGALELSHLFQRSPLAHIARGYPEALRALVAAVEARDAYTRGHSKRVTEVAIEIGQRLGFRGDSLRQLVWGAELHDVGKIGIPDYIMQKPGRLTPDERTLIEQHPAIGWEIVRKLHSLQEVLDVVRYHHERIDGQGYPDGLRGDEIPLAARVVAVADVWDALTSDRSYRPAWSHERALEVMRGGRGTQFDERCLDAFLAYIAEPGPVTRLSDTQPRPARKPGASPAA